jgi:hypothetical protein
MLKRIELTIQIWFSLLKSMGSSNNTIHECSIGWFHCVSLCCVILCISSCKGSTSALSQCIWPMKTAASICPNHQQCSQSTTSLIYGNHSIHLASILLLVHWCLGFMGPLGFRVHGSIGFRVLKMLLEFVMRQTLCEKNHILLCFWGDYISYILMVLVNVCGQNKVCPSTSM